MHVLLISLVIYVVSDRQFSVYCAISLIPSVCLHRLTFKVIIDVLINTTLSLFCRIDPTTGL